MEHLSILFSENKALINLRAKKNSYSRENIKVTCLPHQGPQTDILMKTLSNKKIICH